MSTTSLILRRPKIGASQSECTSSVMSSMKRLLRCQNIQKNGHSTPIKDFWGVVVECKVMPRTFYNSRVYFKTLKKATVRTY